ncbi:MAG: hypothetical protein ABS948_17695 [Solibacillus sp.]
MYKKFYVLLVSILLLSGCSGEYLYSKDSISIGQIGNSVLPDYKNVTITELTIADLFSDTLKNDYDFFIIDPLFFEAVSDDLFIDVFHDKELTVLFLGSGKGYAPFLKQAKGDVPKTYNDYNHALPKQAIFIRYGQDDTHRTTAMQMDKVLAKEDFEQLVQRLYD